MLITTELQCGPIQVVDYHCSAGPEAKPFTELHHGYSVSYVRKGSFGDRTRGESYELVAGSVLVGYPGDEFMCTHDHHVCGHECLAFHLSSDFVALMGGGTETWRTGGLPPLPELMVLGELAQVAAEGRCDIGLNEIGLWFAFRFVEIVTGLKRSNQQTTAHDRRRTVAAAIWINAHSHEGIALSKDASLNPYPWLASVRGDLLHKLGRTQEASAEFTRAAGLTRNARQREFLLGRAQNPTT